MVRRVVRDDAFLRRAMRDHGVERARSERLPWVNLPTPTDEQAAADPRLSAPIFVIEDVTGA